SSFTVVCRLFCYPLLSPFNYTNYLSTEPVPELLLASIVEKVSSGNLAMVDKKIAFAALHHRDFRYYFVGTMLAMMADNIEHVISYWLLYQKFHSPVLAGFAVISHWTPFLFLSVYFGGLADRYDCRKIIQIAQLMYMGVSASWAVLLYTNTIQVWHASTLLIIHRSEERRVGERLYVLVVRCEYVRLRRVL